MHEASLHERNCFITLTYDDEHLPANRSLDVREFQLFMKRLRKAYGPGVRFYHCGEYGEKLGRPHFHALLFNHDFDDRVHFKTVNGHRYYVSRELAGIWGKGHCIVGDVTFESAAYVARYVMKKVTGEQAAEHYGGLKPEYTTMSRRPGIAAGWLDKFRSDVYPDDFVLVRGKKVKPPRFYDNLLDSEDPALFAQLKALRLERGNRLVKVTVKKRTVLVPRTDPYLLAVKEEVKLSRIKSLIRPLEET